MDMAMGYDDVYGLADFCFSTLLFDICYFYS